MDSRDPEARDFSRFFRGELSPAESRLTIRHLLSTWQSCPRTVERAVEEDEVLWDAYQVGRGAPGPGESGIQLGPRIHEHLRLLNREREAAPELVEKLLASPAEEQRSLVRSDAGFQCWTLCELLIEEAHQLVYVDITRAERMSDLALTLAEELDPRIYGSSLVSDLKARAWGRVGEVLRILSDLRSAEEAFVLAESFIGEGSGDALEEAVLLELKAALRRDQRRIDEALRILDEVIAIYRQYRDFHLVGRGFVQKGRVYGAADDFETAIRWLRKGLGLIDPTRERYLELAARHSLMLYLHECGRHQEAWFLLKASRAEFQEHGGRLLSLRLRWLEGKIQHALGSPGVSEAALVEARQGFIAQGIGFSAAAVSLDLAALYAVQQRAAEMRRLAEEMLPIFHSRDLHREAIAALIVFQQAVRMESVNAELLGQIRSYLRRARKDHKLRFDYTL